MTTFTIKKDKEDPSETSVSVFTFWGQHDYEDKEGFPIVDPEEGEDVFTLVDAYAIKVEKGKRTQFYVKRGKYGKLYNPIGLYTEGNAGKQLRHAGRPEWRFETTSKKIFDYYIEFLKTKNVAWLNNAEREV